MIAGIVLAAGLSARMGRPKQLLDWGGQPLVRHVVTQALRSRLDRVLVVISPAIPGLAAALEGLPVTLVAQPEPERGQGSSLSLGVAALPPWTQAAMILLGDQPLIDAPAIDQLLEAASASERTIVAPLIAGRRGHPVLFKARWLPQLAALSGDQGARDLIAANSAELLLVPLAATQADIDTAEEYRRLRPMSHAPLRLDRLNDLDRAEFTSALGFVFEGPPWIVERAWDARPFASLEQLHAALVQVLETAPTEQQVALIRAHPDLVGRAALAGTLTPESTGEQAAAGLSDLSAEEIALFTDFNARYHDRFGFPFVICARENKKASILAGFAERLTHSRDEEIAAALREIAKIARLRLLDRFAPTAAEG